MYIMGSDHPRSKCAVVCLTRFWGRARLGRHSQEFRPGDWSFSEERSQVHLKLLEDSAIVSMSCRVLGGVP
jgi:hypothetical protein